MSKLFGDTPLQLIDIAPDGKLRIVQETRALIEQIGACGRCAVDIDHGFSSLENPSGVGAIVVAGPYHKGKSYLLNRIAKTDNGFKVSFVVPTVVDAKSVRVQRLVCKLKQRPKVSGC
jgi:hypothetical protein